MPKGKREKGFRQKDYDDVYRLARSYDKKRKLKIGNIVKATDYLREHAKASDFEWSPTKTKDPKMEWHIKQRIKEKYERDKKERVKRQKKKFN